MNMEKRKHTRVPVYMKVINETKELDFGFSYARDISSGGMALDTKVFLDKKLAVSQGTKLRLKFKIPQGSLYITAIAEIVRKDKDEQGSEILGVKFIAIEEEARREIENFVSEMKKGNFSLDR